jgi:hypothetical protein
MERPDEFGVLLHRAHVSDHQFPELVRAGDHLLAGALAFEVVPDNPSGFKSGE